MGNLEQILERYGVSNLFETQEFPPSIAQECGPDEVQDTLRLLESFAMKFEREFERGQLIDDEMDDIWFLELRYAKLISSLLPKYSTRIIEYLKHESSRVRFWVIWAIERAPSSKFLEPLKMALSNENDSFNKEMISKALDACSKSIN